MTLLIVILLLQIALLCFVIPVTFVLWAHTLSKFLHVPFVPTRGRYFPQIIDSLDIGRGDVVYELGSGDGRFLLACALANAGTRHVGIERNPLLHLMALLRKKYAGNPSNITFIRGDLFTADLRGATRIYAYLLPSVMSSLLPKFERECAGARLASSAFTFADKEPVEIVTLSTNPGSHGQNVLYVYEF